MRPILFELPFGVPIYSYGLMLTASVLIGWRIALRLAARAGIDEQQADRCALWTLAGAMIGARLLFVVTNLDQFEHAGEIFAWWKGGVVAYGGFLGGLAAAIALLQDAPHQSAGVGRLRGALVVRRASRSRGVGCFLGGLRFRPRLGRAVGRAISRAARRHSVQQSRLGLLPSGAVESLPVHPTQLYEMLAGIVLLVFVAGRASPPACGRACAGGVRPGLRRAALPD